MEIKGLERKFRFSNNGTTLTLNDPDPSRSPEQVMALFANQYSALTTATVTGPTIENDAAVYDFHTTIGTKG